MHYVENGIAEDVAKLCFAGMMVPLSELTEDEYLTCVYNRNNKALQDENVTVVSEINMEGNNELKDRLVDTLGLSTRTGNCLRRAGIDKIGQLCEYNAKELLKIRNMGERSVQELKECLELLGLNLHEE